MQPIQRNPRTPVAPPQPKRNTRRHPSPAHKKIQLLQLCLGCILWLPFKEDHWEDIICVRPGHCEARTIRRTAYGHPVVVLGIQQRVGSTQLGDVLVRVCDITTFEDTPLYGDRSHQGHQELIKHAQSMPIQHESSPPDARWLQLSHGELPNQSYVRLQHVWLIPMSILWNFIWTNSSTWGVRLAEESYYRLMANLCLPAERYESLAELPLLGPTRLEQFSRNYAPPAQQPQPQIQQTGSMGPESGRYDPRSNQWNGHSGNFGNTNNTNDINNQRVALDGNNAGSNRDRTPLGQRLRTLERTGITGAGSNPQMGGESRRG